MRIEYGKFWQLCVERDIKPSFFYSDKSSPYFVSKSTIYEMQHNHSVSMKMIDRICSYFKCQPSDIMEFLDD